MNPPDIAKTRLVSQKLIQTNCSTPGEWVAWMGAVQAQEFPMAKWAIGARLPGSTDKLIEEALNQGSILRTHMLRPTWHFAATEDITWLIDLTVKQVMAAQSYRERVLDLTEEIFSKSNAIIEKTLEQYRPLSREVLVAELRKAGIATDQNRASHLLMRAELEKIICSGEIKNGKQTYDLLPERVKKSRQLGRDEALAEVAKRYFRSRCPATLQDFTWWSGLPSEDAHRALEFVKTDFHGEVINGKTYWFPDDLTISRLTDESVHFLPSYDEFTLSYRDRSASISADLEKHMKVISNRGIFRPIIVVDGQVCGIWKQTIIKSESILEVHLFKPEKLPRKGLNAAINKYADFTDREWKVKDLSSQDIQ